MYRFVIMLLFLFITASAYADLPSTEAFAIKAVEGALADPVSKLRVASDKMHEFYVGSAEGVPTAMVLSQTTTKTSVASTVQVKLDYATTAADNESRGSLTVLVKVELTTDPATGSILASRASFVPKSIQLNRE